MRTKNTMDYKGDNDTGCNWYTWNKLQRIGVEIGKLLNKWNGGHPDNRIVKIGQNTEKSPGDLRRVAVTQTSVKNHQMV